MAEKRTEYGEVINKKVIGQLHNSPKHNFTVQDVAGGGSGDFDIKGYLEGTITEALIPEDVTTIREAAFYDFSSLASAELPNVTIIGEAAFNGCSSLASVEMPNISEIGEVAFSGCTSLSSVEMPNISEIGEAAFSGCTSLSSVEMPNISEIGEAAFEDCTSLSNVVINRIIPPSLGSNAFANCHENLKIYVPASAVNTYKATSGWRDYVYKIVAIEE